MATNDAALEWFRQELAAIKSRRFHIFDRLTAADLEYRHRNSKVRLRGTFANFLREFGWARLYTDHGDAPLVSIYPLRSRRRFVLADGEVYIGFGYRDEQSVFFRESSILTAGESPVFAETAGHVEIVNRTFADWLRESCDWARSTFNAAQWNRILNGPKPFSAREQKIVAARAQFKWRQVGFARNGDAIFEVSNDSDLTLPYLSIGVRGKRGSKLVGAVWLDVSMIKPGSKRRVQQDCYKDQLRPSELELFDLGEPIPEKKQSYWEFKKS